MFIDKDWFVIFGFIMYIVVVIDVVKFLQGLILIQNDFLRVVYKSMFLMFSIVALIAILTMQIIFYNGAETIYDSFIFRMGLLGLINSIGILYISIVKTFYHVKDIHISSSLCKSLFIITWIIVVFLMMVVSSDFTPAYFIFIILIIVHIITQLLFLYTMSRLAVLNRFILKFDYIKLKHLISTVINFFYSMLIAISVFSIVFYLLKENVFSIINIITYVFFNWLILLIIMFRLFLAYHNKYKYQVSQVYLYMLSVVVTLGSSILFFAYLSFHIYNYLIIALLLTISNVILKMLYTYKYNSHNKDLFGYTQHTMKVYYIRNLIFILIFALLIFYHLTIFSSVLFLITIIHSWNSYSRYFSKYFTG